MLPSYHPYATTPSCSWAAPTRRGLVITPVHQPGVATLTLTLTLTLTRTRSLTLALTPILRPMSPSYHPHANQAWPPAAELEREGGALHCAG